MILKNEKTQGFLRFLDFGSPGFSWLRFFFFLKNHFFLIFSCLFHFFDFFFIFYHFFFISFDFFMISCVLQHFRPKNEENVMRTSQKLMSYKQSQKNEDKMIKKCKKDKDQKMKVFFVAFFRLRLTWLFSAPIFRFFKSFLFNFFMSFSFFLISFSCFTISFSFSSISSWIFLLCSIFDQKMRKCDEHLAKSDDNFQPITENACKKIKKVIKNV